MYMNKDKYISELEYFHNVKKRAIQNDIINLSLFRLLDHCILALDAKAKNNVHYKVKQYNDCDRYYLERVHSLDDAMPGAGENILYETMFFSKYGFYEFEEKATLKAAFRRLRNEQLKDTD